MILRTIKDVYLATLMELNKHEAPTILLEDFNYFFNKATLIYINKRINISPIGQQVLDDLAEITVLGYEISSTSIRTNTFPKQYTAILPEDYLHLLRCNPSVEIRPDKYNQLTVFLPTVRAVTFPTTQPINSSEIADIMNNYYLKPSFENIYYSLYQQNKQYKLDFYCGNDPANSIKFISKVYIDYFRVPTEIILTENDIYEQADNSQELEFKPYINQEILNQLLMLIFENITDPRLGTNSQVNQSIGLPQTLQQAK